MRRLLLATAAVAMTSTGAWAQATNIGVILGFTGPLESITPAMAASAELALKEASDSGKLPGGITLLPDAVLDDGWLDVAAIDTRGGVAGWAQLLGEVGRRLRRRGLLRHDGAEAGRHLVHVLRLALDGPLAARLADERRQQVDDG